VYNSSAVNLYRESPIAFSMGGFMLKPPPGTPGKAWPAIAVGLFVAFGGVLFGYDTVRSPLPAWSYCIRIDTLARAP